MLLLQGDEGRGLRELIGGDKCTLVHTLATWTRPGHFVREAGSPVQWQELWSQLYTRLSVTSILELAIVGM